MAAVCSQAVCSGQVHAGKVTDRQRGLSAGTRRQWECDCTLTCQDLMDRVNNWQSCWLRRPDTALWGTPAEFVQQNVISEMHWYMCGGWYLGGWYLGGWFWVGGIWVGGSVGIWMCGWLAGGLTKWKDGKIAYMHRFSTTLMFNISRYVGGVWISGKTCKNLFKIIMVTKVLLFIASWVFTSQFKAVVKT